MPAIQIYEGKPPTHLLIQLGSAVRMTWDFVPYESIYDVWGDDMQPRYFMMVEGNLLLSNTTLIRTHVQMAGQSLVTYGVSSVITYPRERGKGYAAQLVQAATDCIRGSSDADVGMLWCDPKHIPFYEKFGWQSMATTTVLVGDPEKPDAVTGLMMLFVSEKAKGMVNALDGASFSLPFLW